MNNRIYVLGQIASCPGKDVASHLVTIFSGISYFTRKCSNTCLVDSGPLNQNNICQFIDRYNRKPGDNPKKAGAANAETSRAGSDEFAHALYYTEQDFQIVDRVTALAKKHDRPNAQVALAWMLTKPAITAPIIGATKPHHLEDAVAALTLKLDPEDIKALEEPYKPKRVMGHT